MTRAESRHAGFPPPGHIDTLRNRVAHAVCNWVLNHVADATYRAWIDTAVESGLRSIVAERGKNPPFKHPVDDPS